MYGMFHFPKLHRTDMAHTHSQKQFDLQDKACTHCLAQLVLVDTFDIGYSHQFDLVHIQCMHHSQTLVLVDTDKYHFEQFVLLHM